MARGLHGGVINYFIGPWVYEILLQMLKGGGGGGSIIFGFSINTDEYRWSNNIHVQYRDIPSPFDMAENPTW